MKQRKAAKITGVALLTMTIIAIFSIGYAYDQFDRPEQLEWLKNNITQNIGLYYSMLTGILLIIILDFIVSYTLYKYFEEDKRKLALLSGIIRAIYTVIFGIATYFLTKNVNTNELSNQIIKSNFEQFQTIWNCGLVIFGFHILLIGYLMKVNREIPNILSYITIIAGISYMLTSLLKLEVPNSQLVNTLVMILALPMTIGELGLAIWLLIKGGKKVLL